MKNKYYTFLFISNDDSRHEFSLSKYVVIIFLLFEIGIIILAGIGLNRVLKHDELVEEIEGLRLFSKHATRVIKDLNGDELLHQQPDFETVIKKFFENQQDLIPIRPPVKGYITQHIFEDDTNYHPGVDIAAKHGDTVEAPADGLVIFTGETFELGKIIILAHANEFYTLFGHCDTILVSPRQFVSVGESIANVGGTGVSEGPHLHFEIWKSDQLVDPVKFIDEYNDKDVSIRKTR